MIQDTIAPHENVITLREDLSGLYNDREILSASLKFVFKYPIHHNYSSVKIK